MKQLMSISSLLSKGIIAVLVVFVISVRVLGLLCCVSKDMSQFLIPWYDMLTEKGFNALTQPFSNYTPPYLYLLWLATFTQSFLPKVIAIKFLSIVFDVGNAFVIYRILKIKYCQGNIPVLGALLFLALPAVFLNSSFWGQADSIYTFFLLISLYHLLREHPFPAVIAFSLAFAFKVQAIFFAPFLLLLTLKRRIPWYSYGLVPLIYLGMMVPAMIAGRPVWDLVSIYFNQAGTYRNLSMNAPNIYLLIPNTYYSAVVLAGFVIASMIIVIWLVYYSQRISNYSSVVLVLYAAVSSLILPFFLPKMHDRYFYFSDVLLFILAFYLPRLWFVPVICQVVSMLTYSVFLFLNPDTSWPVIVFFLLLAILSNTSLVFFVLRTQYRLTMSPPALLE